MPERDAMSNKRLVSNAFPKPCTATCYLGPASDLYHLSKTLTGLFELAAGSSIDLQLKPIPNEAGKPAETATSYVVVEGGRHPVWIAFDLYDRSGRFDIALLEKCDIYFKRSFLPADLWSLAVDHRQKVVPFGLNYACRAIEALLSQANICESLTRYQNTLTVAHFEQDPQTRARPSVVFQTRAWAPESTSDNAEDVNEGRARIIRELQRAFPKRFEGGFVPNACAFERYPDLLSKHPHEPSQYVTFSKEHLIGVSSRGLHQSVPFKIPEYMAASIAIVSEPLGSELPSPLGDGSDYLEFHSAEECVTQCDRILTNREMADDLRQASRRYYEREVRPVQHVANLLKRAFRSAFVENQTGTPA